jgi:hypothetical protein
LRINERDDDATAQLALPKSVTSPPGRADDQSRASLRFESGLADLFTAFCYHTCFCGPPHKHALPLSNHDQSSCPFNICHTGLVQTLLLDHTYTASVFSPLCLCTLRSFQSFSSACPLFDGVRSGQIMSDYKQYNQPCRRISSAKTSTISPAPTTPN